MMRRGGMVMAVALLAGACSGEPGETPATSAATDAAVGQAGEAMQAAVPGEATDAAGDAAPGGREVKVSNALYEFGYAYPDAAGAIPGLRSLFDRKLEEARKTLIADSRNDRNEAKKDGFPYQAHSSETSWQVVADLPGWLSLSSDISVYTGGAHGMHLFDSLVWDKQAGAAREPADLFAKAALREAIQRPFCDALDREREKRRGEPVRHGADDMFSDCINPLESTLILGSSNRKTFDRVGVLIAPYAAGPYAEGSYEITLPVTQAVLGAVKPEYRKSFSAGR